MSIKFLKKAIELVGGQAALARKINQVSNGRLKLKQQNVFWWLTSKSQKVPAEYVLLIEKATDGKVTRYQLRPDLYSK